MNTLFVKPGLGPPSDEEQRSLSATGPALYDLALALAVNETVAANALLSALVNMLADFMGPREAIPWLEGMLPTIKAGLLRRAEHEEGAHEGR